MSSISFTPHRLLDTLPAGIQPMSNRIEKLLYLEVLRDAHSNQITFQMSSSPAMAMSWPLAMGLTHEEHLANALATAISTCGNLSTFNAPTTTIEHQQLWLHIQQKANDIRARTRRGCNFIWMNSKTKSNLDPVIQLLTGYRIETFDRLPDDRIILSYKGIAMGDRDVGIIVAPHDMTKPGEISYASYFQKNWCDYFQIIDLV